MLNFEIFKKGKLVKRGTTALSTLSWSNELMTTPQLDLTLPVTYAQYFDGREDVKVHINNKTFFGHVKRNVTINKSDETITVPLDHIVCEWEYRQISVNHAIANGKINVIFKGDKTAKGKGNGITANDFSLLSREVNTIKDASLIKRAGANAWSTITGDEVEVTTVDRSKLKKKEGTYNVTFSTAKGTSVTVQATVNANVQVGGERTTTNKSVDPKEKLSARRFTINISDVEDLSDADIIRISKAHAWVYRKPKQKIAITSVTHNIQAKAGEYTVTFKTAKGTELKIPVKVDDSVSPESNVSDPNIIDQLGDIYNDMNFAYPGWQLDFQDGSEDRLIDYVYSRQNKLEALTKTLELTPDLFWRVGFTDEKVIEIGKFGDKKPYVISLKPSGKTNRRIITEPEITKDYENVINVATVYSDKSDGGMSSLTLREVYNRPKEQIDGFPVVILRANVNNERDYSKYITQFPKLAPNNELEYAVIDEESVALESGTVIEGTYAFNDLGSFNTGSKKISDRKRVRAAFTAYKAAIRKLKQARRSYSFTVTVEQMPASVNVGDKIRVIYSNRIWEQTPCSSYFKKILGYDDWFYIEKMTWDIDGLGQEVNTLTLTKYLKVDRETDNQ